jgi:transposase
VFGWRELYRDGLPALGDPTGPMLLPVTVTAEPHREVSAASSAADTIEIELAGKYRVRVGSGVDGKALRRVLDVLERR